MNTPIPLLSWFAAVLLVLAWRRQRLHGLLLVATGLVLAGTAADALLRGAWLLDLRLAEGALLAAAVLFAWGAWEVLDATLHPDSRRLLNPHKRSGASALAHVGLRLLVCAFTAAFALAFGMLAPGLLDALPVLESYAVATAVVLVVWALWPATRYRGRGAHIGSSPG